MSLRVNLFDAAAGELVDGDDVRPGDAEAARRDVDGGVLATYRADATGGELRCLLAATVDGEERAVLAQGRWDDDGYAGVSEPPWSNFERFVVSQLETAGWRVADSRLTQTVFRKLDNRALDPVATGQSSLDGRLGDRPAHVRTPSTPDAVAVLNHLARTADGTPVSVVVAESVPARPTVDVVVTSDGSLSAPVVEPLAGGGENADRGLGAGETPRDGRSRAPDSGATGDGGATDPGRGTAADTDQSEPERGAPGGVGRARRDEPSGPAEGEPSGSPGDGPQGGRDTTDGFDLDALSGGDPFAALDETDELAGNQTGGGGRADAGSAPRGDRRGSRDEGDGRGSRDERDGRDGRRRTTDPDPGSPRRSGRAEDVPRGAPTDDLPRGAPTRESDDGSDGRGRDPDVPGPSERRDTSGTPDSREVDRTPDSRNLNEPPATDNRTQSADANARTPRETDADVRTPRTGTDTPPSETRGRNEGPAAPGQPDTAEPPNRETVSTGSPDTRRSTGPKLGLAPAAEYELRLYDARSGELALSTQRDDPGVDERAVRAADHGVALAVDPQRGRARGTVAAVRNGPEEFVADFDAGGVPPEELAATFVETTRATLDEVGWRPAEGTAGAPLVFEHATDAPPFEPELPGGLAGLLEAGPVDFRVPTHSKAVELFRWVTATVPRAGVAVADAGRTTETEWADVVIQPDETADGVEVVGETADRLDRQALDDRTQSTRGAFETVVEAVTTAVEPTDDTQLEAFLARLLAKRLPADHQFTVTAAETSERRRAVAVGWGTVAAVVAFAATLALAVFWGAFDGLLGVAAPLAGVGLLPSVPVGLQLLAAVTAVGLAAARPAGRFPAVVRWRQLLRAWWAYPPVEESAVFPGSGALLEAPGSGGTLPDRLAALRDSYEASPEEAGRSYGAFLDREVLDTPALAPFSVTDQTAVRRRRLLVVGGTTLLGAVAGLVLAGGVYALAVAASVRPGSVAGAGFWIGFVALIVAGGFTLARSQGYDLGDLP